MHLPSGHGNRRLSVWWVSACWVISMAEPSSGELSVWDGANFGGLYFTNTKFPFSGSVAIHSNWLLRGIPVNREQNNKIGSL